jgi:hypothetical protein
MQPAGGGSPTQSASRMWRSSDGKTRIDTPLSSVISDPAAQHTIVLDHVKKEASIIPMTPPGMPAPPSAPGAPGASAAPPPPAAHVEDLGKSMIEGHEVEGKRFTLPTPPTPPKPPLPAMPAAKMPALKMPGMKMPVVKMPGAPAAPKPPGAPAPPAAPALPKPPSVTELWTSVKLKTPVLTKVTTPAGELTTYCKPTLTAEHPPSVFQIPPGYTIKPPNLKPPSIKPPSIKPPSIKPPTMPKAPAAPKLPKM